MYLVVLKTIVAAWGSWIRIVKQSYWTRKEKRCLLAREASCLLEVHRFVLGIGEMKRQQKTV